MAALDGLKKKVGPLPAWAWGLIVVAVLGYFLFFRRTNSGTSAGAVDAGQSSFVEPISAGAGQINAAQAGQPSTNSAPVDGLSADVMNVLAAQNSDLVTALTGALGSAYDTGAYAFGTATGAHYSDLPDQPAQPASTVSAPTATAAPSVGTSGAKAATAQPFGGIVSTKRLPNGSTVTTYANGRQVQQAPGRTPYVIRQGR